MKKWLIVTLVYLSVFSPLAFANNQYVIVCAPTAKKNSAIAQAVKWYRNSAEKKASYRQVYNIGSAYIKQWVQQHHPKAKTWGVVLDIDETTLDNSWYYYQCSNLAANPTDFEHYVTIPQKSHALPGVVAFTRLVHQLGGYVSLVSNRDGSYVDRSGITSLEATIDNLKQQHVTFDQVILANDKKSKHPADKNPRFNAVTHGCYDPHEMVWSNKLPPHLVIAYFGDNIQDFPEFKQAAAYAFPNDTQQYSQFGFGYFVLPNPLYGSWQANPSS
jgi:5'-nucleotidase (lipoprotein e(P4) family)